MKLSYLLAFVVCVLVGVGSIQAQGTNLNLVFKGNQTLMKRSVGKIKDKADKARWQANIALWNALLGNKMDSKEAKAALKTIVGSVAKIKEGDEKQRWQNNAAVWTAFVGKPPLSRPQALKLADPLKAMRDSAEKLPTGDKRDRWEANFSLFKSVLSGYVKIE